MTTRHRLAQIGILVAAPLAVAAVLIRPAPLPRPNPKLTPGAVLPGVTRVETCDPQWTHRSRNVPDSMKVAVFKAYGLEPTAEVRAGHEIDHLVPVSLAGVSAPVNLWAQPWNGPGGAHEKDLLESALYRDVCTGRVTLAAAQAIFLGDYRAELVRRGLDRPRMKAGPGGDDEPDTEGFSGPDDPVEGVKP